MGARDRLGGAKKFEENQVNTPVITTPSIKQEQTTTVITPKTKTAEPKIVHEVDDSIPVYIRRVMRSDVELDRYGISPFTSTLNLYNRDLISWVSDFSRENKLNGGKPINKSTMIEAILDFVKYDMDVRPDGFKDANELREHLRSKLK